MASCHFLQLRKEQENKYYFINILSKRFHYPFYSHCSLQAKVPAMNDAPRAMQYRPADLQNRNNGFFFYAHDEMEMP